MSRFKRSSLGVALLLVLVVGACQCRMPPPGQSAFIFMPPTGSTNVNIESVRIGLDAGDQQLVAYLRENVRVTDPAGEELAVSTELVWRQDRSPSDDAPGLDILELQFESSPGWHHLVVPKEDWLRSNHSLAARDIGDAWIVDMEMGVSDLGVRRVEVCDFGDRQFVWVNFSEPGAPPADPNRVIHLLGPDASEPPCDVVSAAVSGDAPDAAKSSPHVTFECPLQTPVAALRGGDGFETLEGAPLSFPRPGEILELGPWESYDNSGAPCEVWLPVRGDGDVDPQVVGTGCATAPGSSPVGAASVLLMLLLLAGSTKGRCSDVKARRPPC